MAGFFIYGNIYKASFGTLSQLYKNLATREHKIEIAKQFSTNVKLLESWMHTLSYVRNLCCHNARIWNRTLAIKPVILKQDRTVIQNHSIEAVLYVIEKLLITQPAETKLKFKEEKSSIISRKKSLLHITARQ